MKRCTQNLTDWRVCLNGWTLPKYSLYGKVGRTVYVVTDFTVLQGGNIRLHLWDGRAWRHTHTSTKNHPEIADLVIGFLASENFIQREVIHCLHLTRDGALPAMAKPQVYLYRGIPSGSAETVHNDSEYKQVYEPCWVSY